MGTQRSSKGPGGGVPLVPSWVVPVEVAPEEQQAPPDEAQPEEAPEKEPQQEKKPKAAPFEAPALAPKKRFQGASTNLGKFAQNGKQSSLARGLGGYVRSGYGGAATGAKRMAGTARTAGRLYGGLIGFQNGENRPQEFGLDRAALSGKPAREVGDKIIDAICPVDGSQDAEAQRNALTRAISDLAEQYPNLDLTALSPEQIERLLEIFVGYDIYHRIELDVGKAIFAKAVNYATALKRIEDMRQYIREKVSAAFRALIKKGEKLTRATGTGLMSRVIRDTLGVFEDYLK